MDRVPPRDDRNRASPTDSNEHIDELLVLRAVMEGTSRATGDAFFLAIVENLAKALGTSFASIGLCDRNDSSQIQTYAVWSDGAISENFGYTIKGTPCENALGAGTYVYTDYVQDKFPEDQMLVDMHARCYVGTSLTRENGERIGVLNVLDDKRMGDERAVVAEMVLEIFASRALAEVNHLEALGELIHHKKELESVVLERTKSLEETQKRLATSARLASLGTLASGIAHEINNPLGSISLAAETLRSDPLDPNLPSAAIDHILDAVARCKAIVQNIRRFASDESSPKRPIQLNEPIEAARRAFVEEASQKGPTLPSPIPLELELENDLPNVLANKEEMQQVVLNLIRNAFAAPGVSSITVCSAFDPAKKTIQLIVRDNGAGIAPEDLPHVFDPFFTTRIREGGTGLGLSICHGIILDHRGEITADSEPGRSTTIEIQLPAESS